MLISIIGNSAESLLNFRSSLIRRLTKRGHSVAAFAPDFDVRTRAEVARLDVRTFDFPLSRGGTNPYSDFRTIIALRNALIDLKPDANLSYFVKPAIYGNLAASLARVPRRVVMLEGLGYGFAEGDGASYRRKIIGIALKGMLKWSLANAHHTLVLNEDDRDTLVREVGAAGDRIENMGGIGVELSRFEPVAVRENVTTFAMAARLITEKGVDDYVEAARRIRSYDQGTRFLLLGDVDDNPHSLSREQLISWRDEGVIEWPGRVDNIQDWLKEADVFVLPSFYREGVPRSTQEAMALGRPIITTDHVGCRDTVDDGQNGFLVPTRDVHALAEAMRTFIDTPGLAQKMGKQSRRLAEERFDAAAADQRIISALRA
jgi:glycosyltransferase involved in cell wall biosynthesis